MPSEYKMTTANDSLEHSIKDFLQRPIQIHQGVWSSRDKTENQLFTANFPEVLIENDMYREKLTGFVGLRATLVIKVQVNSQPFQQGRLMLQYIPYAQYMPNKVSLINSTLQGRSGCPRTDLDLSVGTEIEMRIPYVSPHVYYNLVTGQGSFGAIYLVVYSKLEDQVSGTGSIEYTVWAHLEDVDLQFPTGASIFTGSSPNRVKFANKLKTGKITNKDLEKAIDSQVHLKPCAKIYAQMGLELEQIGQQHSISNGVGQLATTLQRVSNAPLLGSVFSRPAWIANTAANVARILGFSKPTVAGLPCESKLRTQTHMANFDGADSSHKTALSAENEIETVPGLAGTSVDEMALTTVLSIPNYWDRFSWSTGDEAQKSLWTNYVTPMKIKDFSTTVTDRFRCTHLGYVANCFGYRRGGGR